MAEYVKREAAKEAVKYIPWCDWKAVGDCIDELPAADVEPVRYGRWILGHVEPGYFTPGGNRPWICSECGQVISWMLDKPKENYCSNCGAKMEVDNG